jgi:hypothetical protein
MPRMKAATTSDIRSHRGLNPVVMRSIWRTIEVKVDPNQHAWPNAFNSKWAKAGSCKDAKRIAPWKRLRLSG